VNLAKYMILHRQTPRRCDSVRLVGLIAGWLAGKIVRGASTGLIGDMAIGIVGAFIASWLLPRLGISLGSGFIRAVINATLGAALFLTIIRLARA
jgi:uncharacterized membrane protein YeaQ/YmgE (transglycosylase-associated protein family)